MTLLMINGHNRRTYAMPLSWKDLTKTSALNFMISVAFFLF